MAVRRHAGDPLPAFLSAEDSSSVALLRAGGVLRLPSPEDPAVIKRLQSADELLCPVETCGAPEMNAALGTVRRHHFRHRPKTHDKTGHSRETAFHEAAKHLLKLWAEQQGATAVVEGEVWSIGRTRRYADTLAALTTPDGPRRVAFEVQYAALRLEGTNGWPERTGDYAAADVPDVWLFGHHGPQMKTTSRRPAVDDAGPIEVLLNAEQQHLARHGHPLRWINPNEQIIATAVVEGTSVDSADDDWWDRPEGHGPRRPRQGDLRATLRLDALADCRLTQFGMVTPTDLWLDGVRQEIEEAADRARAAAEAAAAEEAARREAERVAARLAAEQEAARRREAEQAEARRQEDLRRRAEQADEARRAREQDQQPDRDTDYSPGPEPEPAQHDNAPRDRSDRTPARKPYVEPPHRPGPPVQVWNHRPAVDWDGHPLRGALERLCGQVPPVIEQRLPTDDSLQVDHRVWHATVYARLVHDNIGRSFNRGQVMEALFQDRHPHRSASDMRLAGIAFLSALVDAGWLAELPGANYGVLRDARGAPEAAPEGWQHTTARDGVARID